MKSLRKNIKSIVKLKLFTLIILLCLQLISCSINTLRAEILVENSSENSKKLVKQYFEKWQKEGTSFFELLDEQVIWTVAGNSPVSGIYYGKNDFVERAVQPILKQLSTPLNPELISLTSDKEYVWLHFNAKAITTNGNHYENTYVWKLQLKNNKIITVVAFLDTYRLKELLESTKNKVNMKTIEQTKEYVGMWVTKDGNIRHELLPNNRYDEGRGGYKSAYHGSYKISGNHIDYKDDSGFTADGEFKDGILYHGGMIFHKEIN